MPDLASTIIALRAESFLRNELSEIAKDLTGLVLILDDLLRRTGLFWAAGLYDEMICWRTAAIESVDGANLWSVVRIVDPEPTERLLVDRTLKGKKRAKEIKSIRKVADFRMSMFLEQTYIEL